MRFFRIVQNAANEQGSIFFLWSPEARDGIIDGVVCEDLSGWLIPAKEANEFEKAWLLNNIDDVWDSKSCFARWSQGSDESILINFEPAL